MLLVVLLDVPLVGGLVPDVVVAVVAIHEEFLLLLVLVVRHFLDSF